MSDPTIDAMGSGLMAGGLFVIGSFVLGAGAYLYDFLAEAWRGWKRKHPPAARGLPSPTRPAPQMPPVRNPRGVEHRPTMSQELGRHYMQCAITALERPAKYEGDTEDALRSAEFFIRMARQHLKPESKK